MTEDNYSFGMKSASRSVAAQTTDSNQRERVEVRQKGGVVVRDQAVMHDAELSTEENGHSDLWDMEARFVSSQGRQPHWEHKVIEGISRHNKRHRNKCNRSPHT